MRYDDDKTVKQKMDALDTLTGGIVYGREDAWERLQQRMDKKPVKRRAAWYGIAASVLLLIGVFSLWYRVPEKTVGHVAAQTPVNNKDTIPVSPAINNTGVDNKDEVNIAPHLMAPVTGPYINRHATAQTDTTTPVIIQDPIAGKQVAVNTIDPVIKQPMRVLHINDPDGEGVVIQPSAKPLMARKTEIAGTTTKVIHINELGKMQQALDAAQKQTPHPAKR